MEKTPIPNENIKIPFNVERLDDRELNEIRKKKEDINSVINLIKILPIVLMLTMPFAYIYKFYDNLFFICISIAILLTVVPYYYRSKNIPELVKLLKSDIKNGTVEVYCTSVLSSKFYHYSDFYPGPHFKVAFEGFINTIMVQTTENPQVADSEFIIKRLPKTGFILSVKNKNTNTDIQVYFPEVYKVPEVNQPFRAA